jgi:transposase
MLGVMRAYPIELRRRVVAAVEQGELTIAEIASVFSVGRTFVTKMLRLHRAGDDLTPQHGGGPIPLVQAAEREVLRAAGAKQPDLTLAEAQELMAAHGKAVSIPTVCRVLQALALPRKKKVCMPRSATNGSARSFAGW